MSSRGEKKDMKGGTGGDQEKKVIKMRSNEEKLGRSRERGRRKKQRLRCKLLLREKSFISPKKVINGVLFTLWISTWKLSRIIIISNGLFSYANEIVQLSPSTFCYCIFQAKASVSSLGPCPPSPSPLTPSCTSSAPPDTGRKSFSVESRGPYSQALDLPSADMRRHR